jgi:hypothetical protein
MQMMIPNKCTKDQRKTHGGNTIDKRPIQSRDIRSDDDVLNGRWEGKDDGDGLLDCGDDNW